MGKRKVLFTPDNRVVGLGYRTWEVEKRWALMGTDPRVLAFEAKARRATKEFRIGMRKRAALGELTYRR